MNPFIDGLAYQLFEVYHVGSEVLHIVVIRRLVTLAFLTMLPTLVAIMCLQDRRFFRTFKRIYQYVLRIDDPEETHGRRASKEAMELLRRREASTSPIL
ncbi:hypothetical protein P43SY_010108 [Pythium insidiosum]|uniref:Transmembrane protein n=1 Tax=Pythium insidiosum TaxID=114742 RepID=A0AAD5LA55_PYTIN|nr:hypothetical protein P43SY_010108 [Pythium insidiosum]